MSDPPHTGARANAPAASRRAGLTAAGIRYVASRLLSTGLFSVLLFGAAGRLDWGRAWLFLGITVAGEVLSAGFLAAVSPDVLNQRGTLLRPGTKTFEKIILPIWLVVGYASAVVGGLDAGRFGWSALPAGLIFLGVALMAAAYVIGTWAMAVNPFFEPTVRIQTERGHRVATAGPYRIVRHPGYLGAILGGLATPFVLGSVWMVIPVGLAALLFVLRTALEDRTLERELPGYAAYMQRTRYRLFPGVW